MINRMTESHEDKDRFWEGQDLSCEKIKNDIRRDDPLHVLAVKERRIQRHGLMSKECQEQTHRQV